MCTKVFLFNSDSKSHFSVVNTIWNAYSLKKTTHNKGIHTSGKFKQQQNIMIALTAVAEVKEKYWSKNTTTFNKEIYVLK